MIIRKRVSKIIVCLLAVSVALSLFFNFNVVSEASAFPSINSESYVLMDAETGQVLVEKGMNQRMYPASITKIMTILLACEEANFDTVVTMSEYATVTTVPRDSSHIALTTGQKVRMEDLIYGAMLASANDACNGIAESISGSIDAFALKMTEILILQTQTVFLTKTTIQPHTIWLLLQERQSRIHILQQFSEPFAMRSLPIT